MNNGEPSLAELQSIAESVVGPVEWNGPEGYIPCPGAHRHTTPTASTNCKVVVEPIPGACPGVYCFHSSCQSEVDALAFSVRSALGKRTKSDNPRPYTPTPKPRPKLEFQPDKLAAMAARLPGIDEAYFAARSKKTVADRTPASFLHTLYNPGEKVIIFTNEKSQGDAVWTRQEGAFNANELHAFTRNAKLGVWFLSAPVTGEFSDTGKVYPKGHTRAGQKVVSRRWEGAVTAWRYLLLESDEADTGQWLSLLAQLPNRIAAIYTSGSRSIHSLIRLDAVSKEDWDERAELLKQCFVPWGGCRKAISAVRLTRLPGCERLGKNGDDGQYIKFPTPQMQRLLYLNPAPDGTPIFQQEVTNL